MNCKDKIEINYDISTGKSFIKGTRISLELISELIENGWDTDQIINNCPQLKKGDILLAIEYALFKKFLI
jgi:uncharacterized protein (DUF433 family)